MAVLVVATLLPVAGCGAPGPQGPRDVVTSAERSALAAGSSVRSVTVAVVDGGIDERHPALLGAVVGRWRAPGLVGGTSPHGTQLAGIVAGRATAAYAGGLAPTAELVDLQALDARGVGTPADLAAALRFADGTGAEVVLTSLAREADDPAVRAAVAALTGRGAVVVAASGNSFTDAPVYPASYPGVLSVAALDRRGRRLQLSGWGSAAVAAVTGTSAAAAVAAGLVAACADHRPLSGRQIRAPWTNGRVTDAGRARPRLTCPGDDDEGGR